MSFKEKYSDFKQDFKQVAGDIKQSAVDYAGRTMSGDGEYNRKQITELLQDAKFVKSLDHFNIDVNAGDFNPDSAKTLEKLREYKKVYETKNQVVEKLANVYKKQFTKDLGVAVPANEINKKLEAYFNTRMLENPADIEYAQVLADEFNEI